MVIPRYQKATQEEIDELTKLVKKVDSAQHQGNNKSATFESSGPRSDNSINSPPLGPVDDRDKKKLASLFEGGIAYVETTREPLLIDNPVQLLLMLMPELRPYKWQFEEMMRVAGYLKTGCYAKEDKSEITRSQPYNFILCAANGSGKDAVFIAACAVWFVLTGLRNRVVITSASFDQIKFQTEVHIRELISRANKLWGKLFKSIQFHHIVPALGGEIKLFATDQPTLAEGYHAFHGGKLMRIINEAKTVTDEIFDATERWTGVSHTLLVSSPGRRRGTMFSLAGNAIHYPASPCLGTYYFRKVTAFECPHIPLSVIQTKIEKHGESSPLIRSMIFAEFSDYEEPVVIPESVFDGCANFSIQKQGTDIGIGLDLAAGGDEDAGWVRKGNKIIHSFFFRLSNTDLAADLIDKQLSPWSWQEYSFNADNGGVGKGIIDKLVTKGWRINRCNNQAPAFNKREFLNLGAESWMHVRRLLERRIIIVPKNIPKLREQLTTRYFVSFENTQGKLQLESKKEARLNGRPSPDRADGFVLCFWSYKPPLVRASAPISDGKVYMSLTEFIQRSSFGILRHYITQTEPTRFTLLSGPLVETKRLTNGR